MAPRMTFGELRTKLQQEYDAGLVARVEKGLVLLKEKWGEDFANHIDLATLNLADEDQCVLGQLYDNAQPTKAQWNVYIEQRGYRGNPHTYADGFTKGLAILDGDVSKQPSAFGFDLLDEESYDDLNDVWVTVLEHEQRA